MNCGREEAFAERSGVTGDGTVDRRAKLTQVKWLDGSLATQKSLRPPCVEEEKEGTHARFTRPGDRSRADTGPGLPKSYFVVV